MGSGDYDDDEERVKNGDSSLLSLMDGTFKTKYRKVFLLTTNNTWINDNMINRPGRIRYLKQFSDLTKDQIMEIIDDCLLKKEYVEDIMSFIKPLKIITVDIIKSIISEINIFDETPQECCKDFNLEFKQEYYTMTRIDNETGDEAVIEEQCALANVDAFIEGVTNKKENSVIRTPNYYFKHTTKLKEIPGKIAVTDVYGNYTKPFYVSFKKHKPLHNIFAY